jgi:hypothetical protein
MTSADARVLNWRFVVPDVPAGLLLLGTDGERLPTAVAAPSTASAALEALDRRYPAVAAPDLGRWSSVCGEPPARVAARAARAVGPGGWLFVGFANRGYPPNLFKATASRPAAVRSAIEAQGLAVSAEFFCLPSERCPAYLVPTRRPAELDHVLRSYFVAYLGGGAAHTPRVRRLALSAMRKAVLAAPTALRRPTAPALALVARRST